jgi:hypothetical protein
MEFVTVQVIRRAVLAHHDASGPARLLTIMLASLCFASAAAATTYYVGPRGCDDGGAGTAQAAPWCTLAKANATLAAGDTVLIAAGTYGDQIRPVNDGASDESRIVYRALGDGNVVLTAVGATNEQNNAPDIGAIALGGKSFVTVDGAQQAMRVVPGRIAFSALANFSGASSCVIDSVYFDGSTETGGMAEVVNFNNLYGKGTPESRFNVLRRSRLVGKGDDAKNRIEDLIHVAGNAHHNLVEQNVIESCWHVNVNCGGAGGSKPHDNVIRGNTIRNRWHTGLQFYDGGAVHNLAEGNVISATGGGPSPPGGVGNAFEASPTDHVIRYNVMERGGSTNNDAASIGGAVFAAYRGSPTVSGNRIYNNTIVKNNGFGIGFMLFTGGVSIRDNKIVNNFIYGVNRSQSGMILNQYWDNGTDTGDRYVRNVFGTPGGMRAQRVIASNKPRIGAVSLDVAIARLRNPANPEYTAWHGFANAYDANPGFRDYDGGDYRLSPGSAYIDTGAPLTHVAAGDAGSGTSLRVDDARFFWGAAGYPSWMGIQGDTIAVGRLDRTVPVASVDVKANVLVLATAVPRSVGDAIWVIRDTAGIVRVKGSGPDVGAFESDAATARRR